MMKYSYLITVLLVFNSYCHKKVKREAPFVKETHIVCQIKIIERKELGYKKTLNRFIEYSNKFLLGSEKKKCYLKAIYESEMDREVYGNYHYFLDSLFSYNKQFESNLGRISLNDIYNLSLSIPKSFEMEKIRQKRIIDSVGLDNLRVYDFLSHIHKSNLSEVSSPSDYNLLH